MAAKGLNNWKNLEKFQFFPCFFYLTLKLPSIFDEIFGLSASVDIRPPIGGWVAELLGVVLGVRPG